MLAATVGFGAVRPKSVPLSHMPGLRLCNGRAIVDGSRAGYRFLCQASDYCLLFGTTPYGAFAAFVCPKAGC